MGGAIGRREIDSVGRMLEAERHRGPDGDGVYSDEQVVLGHRRLSIIDLSLTGKQPMSNEHGTIWVTFNGEIYNYRELTQELQGAGHEFRSNTDTEVLLHGFEEWGIEGLVRRLLGMFAFALYDASVPGDWRVFLVRDRLGIKPLYYHASAESLAFASEVGALVKSGLASGEADLTGLVGFLAQGSVPSPWTCVRNAKCLEAGHFMMVQRNRQCVAKYWTLSYSSDGPDQGADLLRDSVVRHLVADVPVGLFLSGGVDSAGLVALARRRHDGLIVTLTITFDEDQFNEGKMASRFAERFRTEHHEIRITAKTFMDHLPRFFSSVDQPTCDGINTYLVSLAASRLGLKVVLSGLGGDEVYFGYRHYRVLANHPNWVDRYGALQPAFRDALARMMALYGSVRSQERWRRFGYWRWCPPPLALYLLFRGFYPEAEIGELLGMDEKRVRETLLSAFESQYTELPLAPAHVFNRMEMQHYLHDQLLRDSDVFSMAHSLELRVPYLDHRLVESLAAVEPANKVDQFLNKPRLVNAIEDDLVSTTARNRKMGFSFPLATWIKEHAAELEARCLSGSHFDPRA
ncbi:MAG: asparagine synthase (glutamine-hydrolyzing), partial [Solirubrobacteraceae bacterium]